MISAGGYVKYRTIKSREALYEWLAEETTPIYSNREDYRTVIAHQCDYKDKHSYTYGKKQDKKVYTNIYAHTLEIMIPIGMKENKKHEFIKKFMLALNPCFKLDSFLYCYKFYQQGKGNYIRVLCFTRKYFKRKQEKTLKYERDYYYNQNTKQLCRPDHPDAKLVHKKGDVKRDRNGKVLKETFYVSKVEKEIFKYTSFHLFHKRLLKAVEYANLLLNRDFWKQQIKFFSKVTIKQINYISKAKLALKNQMITRINQSMTDIQEALMQGKIWKDCEREFHKLIYKINNFIYLSKWKEPVSGSSIYLGTKQSETSLKDNISLIEEYIESMIKDWFIDVFPTETTVIQNHDISLQSSTEKSLKESDKYWIDGYKNKWSKERYTYDEALEYSKTLIDCSNCVNCLNCIDCHDCVDCIDCHICYQCNKCYHCTYCEDIYNHYNYRAYLGIRKLGTSESRIEWTEQLINTFSKLWKE